MKFEKNIYAETISIIRKMFSTALLFVLGSILLVILKEASATSQIALFVPELFLWATLAYLAHRYVLLPDHLPFENFSKQITQFFRRFLGLSLISILPVILLSIAMVVTYYDGNSLNKEQVLGLTVLLSLVLGGIIAGFVLSVYGTWLPASIMNDNTGLKHAGARGRKSFFQNIGSTYYWTSAGKLYLNLSFLRS